MVKHIFSQDKISLILKYIGIYSIFVLSVIFCLSNNRTTSMFPDFGMVIIFFLCYIWFHIKSIFQAPINLFLFGLVIDAYTYMPIGLSSFSLLLAYKLTEIERMFLFTDENNISFIRDCFVFMFLFYVVKWFLFSFYMENFYLFRYVFFDIIKNLFVCILIRILYTKFRKNV